MWSLRLAQLVFAAPAFPGQATLLQALRRRLKRHDGPIADRFGPGVRVEVNPAGGQMGPLLLRFRPPALAPILEAALRPGDTFADVGANVGIYTLLGAHHVGKGGQVHSFEAIEDVATLLRRNVALNAFEQVEIVPSAVGREPGNVTLYRVVGGASGLTSGYPWREEETEPVEVPLTTLDAHYDGRPSPRLIKIDVEGMEFDVLRGADALLSRDDAPLVVFEISPARIEKLDYGPEDVLGYLASHGFTVYDLEPGGLRVETGAGPLSENVLAARSGLTHHDETVAALRGARFPRDQTI